MILEKLSLSQSRPKFVPPEGRGVLEVTSFLEDTIYNHRVAAERTIYAQGAYSQCLANKKGLLTLLQPQDQHEITLRTEKVGLKYTKLLANKSNQPHNLRSSCVPILTLKLYCLTQVF